MKSVEEFLKKHSEWQAVATIFHTLEARGHAAYLAGGCVRDALLGRPANDLDIATDATPDQIETYFPQVVNVGKSFGVMRVLVGGEDIELATFRSDGSYADGRRPDSVSFTSPEEDAKRRDFTINALFYDLKTQKVLDFVGGTQDLDKKILRTVGEPEKRFREDHLRLLRGARFVAQLGFELDPETRAAIGKHAGLIKSVSGERVRDEMGKLLAGRYPARGLEIMIETGLLSALFPNLPARNFPEGEAAEVWKNLALLFKETSADDLQKFTKLLRLSAKELKNIEDFWKVLQKPTDFFAQRPGKIWQAGQQEGVLWALHDLEKRSQQFSESAHQILKELKSRTPLPEAFLRGADLQGTLSGKAMGLCLQEAYLQQLEQNWNRKEQATVWLAEALKKGLF